MTEAQTATARAVPDQTGPAQPGSAGGPAGAASDTAGRQESPDAWPGIPAELLLSLCCYDTDSAGGCG